MNNLITLHQSLSLIPPSIKKAITVREFASLAYNHNYIEPPKGKLSQHENSLIKKASRILKSLVNNGFVECIDTKKPYLYYRLETFKNYSQLNNDTSSSVHHFSDADVNARLINIYDNQLLTLTNKQLVKIPQIIKAIKKRRKLTFDYYKSKHKTYINKTCEPLGLFNNNGNVLLVGANNKGKIRYYTLVKIENIEVNLDEPIFHLSDVSQEQALSILTSGMLEYFLTDKPEKIVLRVKKDAALTFLSNDIKHSTDYQFTWINRDKVIGEVSFSRQISLCFIRYIQGFGKNIEVLQSDNLIEHLNNNHGKVSTSAKMCR